jgi:hypothetical protein
VRSLLLGQSMKYSQMTSGKMINININDRGFKIMTTTEAIYTHPLMPGIEYRLHNGKYQFWRDAKKIFHYLPTWLDEPGYWVNSGLPRGFKLKILAERQEMLVKWHYQHCLAQAGLA